LDKDRDFSIWFGVTSFFVCDHTGQEQEINVLDADRLYFVEWHVIDGHGRYVDVLERRTHADYDDCCSILPAPPNLPGDQRCFQ
jgi:hypothetical protein